MGLELEWITAALPSRPQVRSFVLEIQRLVNDSTPSRVAYSSVRGIRGIAGAFGRRGSSRFRTQCGRLVGGLWG